MEPTANTASPESNTLAMLRWMLLCVLSVGLLGLGTGLLLLKHVESPTQLIAPGLIAVALLVVVWHVLERGPASILALDSVMVLFIAA
ncbi:MAG TPA: hypothetical protein VK595_05180, partial [Vicinamibacterales bacterium]|nr:hypothetical protein [Vicinamibacterales bacterium]